MTRKLPLTGLLAGLALISACERSPSAPPAPPATASAKMAPLDPQAGPPTPVGHWAEEPEYCRVRPWTVTQTQLTTGEGAICVLSAVAATANGWTARARCPALANGLLTLNTARSEPETLVISGPAFVTPARLVRCGRDRATDPTRDPHQPLQAATEINRRIATGRDGLTETTFENNAMIDRVWRQGGDIVKIVEPIVGAGEGRERAYYFRAGERSPFLIEDPSAIYAFSSGRLITWFTPRGEIISDLQVAQPDERERRLLSQAMILRAIADTGDPLKDAGR